MMRSSLFLSFRSRSRCLQKLCELQEIMGATREQKKWGRSLNCLYLLMIMRSLDLFVGVISLLSQLMGFRNDSNAASPNQWVNAYATSISGPNTQHNIFNEKCRCSWLHFVQSFPLSLRHLFVMTLCWFENNDAVGPSMAESPLLPKAKHLRRSK